MAVMFSFTVQSDAVRLGLAAILARVRDLTPFWRDVFAPVYFGQIQDLFAMEGQGRGAGGRFGPGHWTQLSPAYAAWKKRHFPGMRILQRTGRLRESLDWNGSSLGADGVFIPGPASVVVGTDVPYGKYHQRGTNTMPAREFLPTPDAVQFSKLMRDWILSGEVS